MCSAKGVPASCRWNSRRSERPRTVERPGRGRRVGVAPEGALGRDPWGRPGPACCASSGTCRTLPKARRAGGRFWSRGAWHETLPRGSVRSCSSQRALPRGGCSSYQCSLEVLRDAEAVQAAACVKANVTVVNGPTATFAADSPGESTASCPAGDTVSVEASRASAGRSKARCQLTDRSEQTAGRDGSSRPLSRASRPARLCTE